MYRWENSSRSEPAMATISSGLLPGATMPAMSTACPSGSASASPSTFAVLAFIGVSRPLVRNLVYHSFATAVRSIPVPLSSVSVGTRPRMRPHGTHSRFRTEIRKPRRRVDCRGTSGRRPSGQGCGG